MLAILALTAFGPSLSGGFIWDDDAHFEHNPAVQDPRGLVAIWTTGAAGYYPLVLTIFWAMRRIVGLWPPAYHLLNILMHAAVMILLWRTLRRLNVPGAWLGAACFGVHPLQVESVAWVTELKNTQSGVFTLLALLLFLRYDEQRAAPGSRRWLAAAMGAHALAVLSKTSTVMLPVIALMCLWWRGSGAGRRAWLGETAPLFAISALGALLTVWVQTTVHGVQGEEYTQSLPERCLNAGWIAGFYALKNLWPVPLMFIYPRWEVDPMRAAHWAPSLAVAGLVLALWLARRHAWGRAAFMTAACYLILLFPVMWFLNTYFTRYSYVGDHFQYLPGMALWAGFGAALWQGAGTIACKWTTPARRWAVQWIAGAATLGTLAGASFAYAPVFHDNERLWRDTLRKNPRAWMAHLNLAILLTKTHRPDEAMPHYREALKERPGHANAQAAYAEALAAAGQLDEAAAHYEAAVRIDPRLARAWASLAAIRGAQGRPSQAAELARRALDCDPNLVEAHENLAVALQALGQSDQSSKHRERARQLRARMSPALP